MCPGVKQNMESSRLHSIPIEIDENSVCPSTSKEIYRAEGCHLLSLSLSSTCEKCVKIKNEHSGHVKRTEKKTNVAAKPRAPLSCTHPTEQQKHNLQGSFRFHPMIIRFALALATAYDELRKSGSCPVAEPFEIT